MILNGHGKVTGNLIRSLDVMEDVSPENAHLESTSFKGMATEGGTVPRAGGFQG